MLVKRIRSRGSNIVVEANGEVLFAPGTELSAWKNRFSQRVLAATQEAAPTNKRPRWGHYGKPLKSTFKASTSTRITSGGGFFYIAVGSTAPHAYYVDQGTGIYAGNAPYEAKVLPPWHRGSPSLYESTWRPGNGHWSNAHRVKPVFIKGQKGQHFFDEGLKRGFQSMRMRSFQVPGEGISGMTSAMATLPTGLLNFLGNTPADGAFRASLEEWRAWRDEAYNAGRVLGVGHTAEHARRRAKAEAVTARRQFRREANKVRRAQASKIRSQIRRDKIKAMNAAKSTAKPKSTKAPGALSRSQDKARVKALASKKFGAANITSIEYDNGRWEVVVRQITVRAADGGLRPEFKVYHIKAKS